MVIALGKVVWNIRFSLWYSDDQRKRDEYFQGYIRRLGEEKEAENTA
jgi:hypothetical protein